MSHSKYIQECILEALKRNATSTTEQEDFSGDDEQTLSVPDGAVGDITLISCDVLFNINGVSPTITNSVSISNLVPLQMVNVNLGDVRLKGLTAVSNYTIIYSIKPSWTLNIL